MTAITTPANETDTLWDERLPLLDRNAREASDPDAALALIEEIATEIDDLAAFCYPDPAERQSRADDVLQRLADLSRLFD